MRTETAIDHRNSPVAPSALLAAFILLPILFNALALLSEVRYATPNDNDQIFHYLFVERANQAIDAGDNPFDHWLPELDLGFPEFFYYQNLPHLAVVATYRLLLRRLSLLTVLNLLRYLLLLSFPLTVNWSMRRMEFSPVAAGTAGAFCSVLSSQTSFGFDYRSYVWNGFGMYPQLCAMHLIFIAIACVQRVLARGTDFAAAILASSALVLSDLLYAYIFAVMVLLLWLLSMSKQARLANWTADGLGGILRISARLGIVAGGALLITAYQTVPFLRRIQYINTALPYFPAQLLRDRPQASAVLANILAGHRFDYHRLPALTVLVAIGIVYAAIRRRDESKIALTIFVTSEVVAFARVFLAPLFKLLPPLAEVAPLIRFNAGVDLAAIMLIGLGVEMLWEWRPPRWPKLGIAALIATLAAAGIIAFGERWTFYSDSADEMRASSQALRDDADLAQIISALKGAAPGRVYAGTRGNWGNWLSVGHVYVYDLLPIDLFDTVMPWQTLSLTSPLLWSLNIPDSSLCHLFNIHYIVAPPTLHVPPFYRPVVTTSRYILYEVDSGGYMELGRIGRIMPLPRGSQLSAVNADWINGPDLAEDKFIAFTSKESPEHLFANLEPDIGSPQSGLIENEVVTPDSFRANVTVTAPSSKLLVIKTTYHPNWHMSIDGHEQRAFMVSPSFIGTLIPPGRHVIKAEYRSATLKNLLLVVSAVILFITAAIRWFDFKPTLLIRMLSFIR